MAVLSAETNMAGVSELSPAIFLSSATLTGFILMKSKIAFGRKMRKNILIVTFLKIRRKMDFIRIELPDGSSVC